MLTATIKQIVAATLHSLRSSKTLILWRRRLSPSALFVELRCARRIDALSRRLMGMQRKIGALSAHLLSGRADGAVDADRSLRRMLGELKDDLNGIRRDLAQWYVKECRGRTGPRLDASITHLNRVAADTYAAADRLEWEIEEHDRRFCR
ncbi:hypothetical protein [Massilia horti]|uniref:Uncharacterized protein n=1 Tax=Massilia horti TaxID=2562153 RepID=A0A4Y9ST23_9BURK|nr:hypothetical protein [Massilia horti]TFW28374.1 hypothetical protein E4O92_21355 [Massilia horti]